MGIRSTSAVPVTTSLHPTARGRERGILFDLVRGHILPVRAVAKPLLFTTTTSITPTIAAATKVVTIPFSWLRQHPLPKAPCHSSLAKPTLNECGILFTSLSLHSPYSTSERVRSVTSVSFSELPSTSRFPTPPSATGATISHRFLTICGFSCYQCWTLALMSGIWTKQS